MTHKAFVCDLVAIDREITLPDACPRCRAEFGPGSKNVKCWHLRPYFDKVRLTKVIACGKETDVVETLPTTQQSVNEPWIRIPAIYKCANCGYALAQHHTRKYELHGMSQAYAFKLQGLLYDDNVLDPTIKQKVWANDSCVACTLEASIGTEEVPHPIDSRVHSCKRNT